jgi:hypothetical protein
MLIRKYERNKAFTDLSGNHVYEYTIPCGLVESKSVHTQVRSRRIKVGTHSSYDRFFVMQKM